MPDLSISGLTSSAANLAATDVLPVVQTTGVGPVKMTGTQLKSGIIGAGSVSIASGKTFTVNNTLTFTGTDASSVAFGAGGTVVYTASPNITTPTFTTSATGPLFIGGTGTTSTLTLRSTSNVGTTGSDIIFQTGNNGATEAMRIVNSGNVAIGTTNAGFGRFTVSDNTVFLVTQPFAATSTGYFGCGTNHPLALITNNAERMRITSGGDVVVTGVGGLGYGTGSGGAVTQATSRTTGVTLDKTNGAITLVSAAGSATYQTFTVTNSNVAATDTIIINQKSGADEYITLVTAVSAGSFDITFATTGGTTTEQPVFNFAVVKAVTS